MYWKTSFVYHKVSDPSMRYYTNLYAEINHFTRSLSFEQNKWEPEGRKIHQRQAFGGLVQHPLCLEGCGFRSMPVIRTQPHKGTILNSKVYSTDSSEIDLHEYKENRMHSGGKREIQKSWANIKIMTSTLLWVVMKPFTKKYVNWRQTFCSTESPLCAISYWIHSFYTRSICWNRKQFPMNVHKSYIDIPVVIPPNRTCPWCTSVPDQDPMEALVKSWFKVHKMKYQSTNLFWSNWSKTNLSTPAHTWCTESSGLPPRPHARSKTYLLQRKRKKKPSVCTKYWRWVPLNAKLKCLGLQTTLCWINRIRLSWHF